MNVMRGTLLSPDVEPVDRPLMGSSSDTMLDCRGCRCSVAIAVGSSGSSTAGSPCNIPESSRGAKYHTVRTLLRVDDVATVRTLGPLTSRTLGGLVLDEQPRLGNCGPTQGTVAEVLGCHAKGGGRSV